MVGWLLNLVGVRRNSRDQFLGCRGEGRGEALLRWRTSRMRFVLRGKVEVRFLGGRGGQPMGARVTEGRAMSSRSSRAVKEACILEC